MLLLQLPHLPCPSNSCLSSLHKKKHPLHLSWLLCKAAYKGVTIWPSCGSIVVVLDDDCLLASVLAGEKDDHLPRLQTEKCVYQLLVRPPYKMLSQRLAAPHLQKLHHVCFCLW